MATRSKRHRTHSEDSEGDLVKENTAPRRNADAAYESDDNDELDQSRDDDEEFELTDMFSKKKTGKRASKGQGKAKKKAKSVESSLIDGIDDENDDEEADLERHHMESGHIVRIYVENFMCHKKLTVDFGRHVNFVTGENGSGKCEFLWCLRFVVDNSFVAGKSAIVVAVQLCLGGSARVTGRGQSLSTLIREGSDGPAILRATLHNVGEDAYKPEEYGSYITIERKIPKSGTAQYRIMSGMGTSHDKVSYFSIC